MALDRQYSKAAKEHPGIVAELESEMLEGEEQDEKGVAATRVHHRDLSQRTSLVLQDLLRKYLSAIIQITTAV